ncbi:MAG: glycosyl transferase group 1 [Ramlibacter sp.]|nr:glycosyl transferase group 1 [Ramlibacter sp.]
MRILHLAPLWYPISRSAPGGIETLLAELIDVQVSAGLEVAVVASANSETPAQLLSAVDSGVVGKMAADEAAEYEYFEQHQLSIALAAAADYDIIHSHIGSCAYLLSHLPGLRNRVLHTVHGAVLEDMAWYVRAHSDMWISTVSEYQGRKLRVAGAVRCRTIYNGIDTARFRDSAGGGGLLFLGRIEARKGVDAAIRVARELGERLALAGPVYDQRYFDSVVAPQLDERIRYVGVADHETKLRLLGAADCVLVPSRIAEAFGMVCVEAGACGTPVVALANGALPEVVAAGITGFVTADEGELAALVVRARGLNRSRIREHVSRFDIARSAQAYGRLYADMLEAP